MQLAFVTPDVRRFDRLKGEALVLSFFEDVRPLPGALSLADWRLAGQVTDLVVRGSLSGAQGERALLPLFPKLPFDKLFLFGAGPAASFDGERFSAVVEDMMRTLAGARVRTSVLALPGRSVGRIAPEEAMGRFLQVAQAHPTQDQVTLIEGHDAQKAMQPLLEQKRRRERADDET